MSFKGFTHAEYTSYATDGPALGFPGDFLINATTTQFVIDKPAGVVAGDILVFGFQPSYEATPNRQSSGQFLTITGPGTWTKHLWPPFGILGWVCWKIAGASEPSSYTIEIHNTFDNTIVPAYGLLIMGAWSDPLQAVSEFNLADPSLFNVNATGSQWSGCFRSSPPAFADIDSCGITGSEVLTNSALIVYFVGARAGYENGHDTSLLPGSEPWVDVSIDPPITQHAQNHFERLPELHDGTQAPLSSVRTLAVNRSWTMGSEYVGATAIPNRSASFGWQRTSAMGSQFAYIYRLVLLPGELLAYWGILAVPL